MRIEKLCKAFGQNVVLDDFSLNLEENTITCITGESGCGKTTLLNLIAGIAKPDAGSVQLGPRAVSYLFQEPRLLPWRTVLENVAIPLKGDEQKAREFLELVGLKDALDKYPAQLSGGMSQRVAMARAFSFPSDVILMDEPFQSLDIKLRSNLLKAFLKLWEENKRTVLWVTHDITEACLAADLVLCVAASPTSGPMQVVDSFEIKKARSERTAESMAQLQAKIYQTLIK